MRQIVPNQRKIIRQNIFFDQLWPNREEGGFPPSNVRSRVGNFWSKPSIFPPDLVIIGQKICFVLNLKKNKKLGKIWSKLSIPPLTSFIKGHPYRDGPKGVQFDSNCLILSQLVIFCLIWSYFDIPLTSYVKGHPCTHGPKVGMGGYNLSQIVLFCLN